MNPKNWIKDNLILVRDSITPLRILIFILLIACVFMLLYSYDNAQTDPCPAADGFRKISSGVCQGQSFDRTVETGLVVLPNDVINVKEILEGDIGDLETKISNCTVLVYNISTYSWAVLRYDSVNGTVVDIGEGRLYNPRDDIFMGRVQINYTIGVTKPIWTRSQTVMAGCPDIAKYGAVVKGW